MSDTKNDANSPYGKAYSAKVAQAMTFDASLRDRARDGDAGRRVVADVKRSYP